jgi:aspartate racemase
MKRVGILGGMGPEATVLLMQKIIAATPATDDADHIPLIVDQNPQVPSRIRHLIEGTGEDPAPVLAAMAKRLETAGAEALAMPCNTAHHYAPAIRSAVTIPLIDMVALSVAHALRLAGPGGTVAILASPAVRKIELFDRAFADTGLIPVYPQDDAAMLATIRLIKAQGATPAARNALTAASTELAARGARVQMIACTEFSLISEAVDPAAQAFDTLDRLVEGIIAFATADGTDRRTQDLTTRSAKAPHSHPNKESTP